MKIIEQPNRKLIYPTCRCELEWKTEDLVDVTDSSIKYPRIHCSVCKQLILIGSSDN